MSAISSVIHSDLDILGGLPVFIGTRVPIQTFHCPRPASRSAATDAAF
jgi:hypothetical protein